MRWGVGHKAVVPLFLKLTCLVSSHRKSPERPCPRANLGKMEFRLHSRGVPQQLTPVCRPRNTEVLRKVALLRVQDGGVHAFCLLIYFNEPVVQGLNHSMRIHSYFRLRAGMKKRKGSHCKSGTNHTIESAKNPHASFGRFGSIDGVRWTGPGLVLSRHCPAGSSKYAM